MKPKDLGPFSDERLTYDQLQTRISYLDAVIESSERDLHEALDNQKCSSEDITKNYPMLKTMRQLETHASNLNKTSEALDSFEKQTERLYRAQQPVEKKASAKSLFARKKYAKKYAPKEDQQKKATERFENSQRQIAALREKISGKFDVLNEHFQEIQRVYQYILQIKALSKIQKKNVAGTSDKAMVLTGAAGQNIYVYERLLKYSIERWRNRVREKRLSDSMTQNQHREVMQERTLQMPRTDSKAEDAIKALKALYKVVEYPSDMNWQKKKLGEADNMKEVVQAMPVKAIITLKDMLFKELVKAEKILRVVTDPALSSTVDYTDTKELQELCAPAKFPNKEDQHALKEVKSPALDKTVQRVEKMIEKNQQQTLEHAKQAGIRMQR